MIEQAVYFALGFLVAALLALGILPAFWRRAYRLTRREIEATLPLSPREIAAERDQLRARFAVERVQLEQAVEAADADRQRAMALAGERTIAIQKLDETLAARRADIADLETRVQGLEEVLATTRTRLAETEVARDGVTAALAGLQGRHEALDRDRAELQDLSDQRRVEIAAQKMNLEAQRARIEELDAALKASRAETRARNEELRETARKLRDTETDLAVALGRVAASDEVAERRAQIIAERDATIADQRQAAAERGAAARQQESELLQAMRRAESAEKSIADRDQTLARLTEEARTTASDLARSVDRLRADKQKLQESLTETRSRAARLQRELALASRGTKPAGGDRRAKVVSTEQ